METFIVCSPTDMQIDTKIACAIIFDESLTDLSPLLFRPVQIDTHSGEPSFHSGYMRCKTDHLAGVGWHHFIDTIAK